MLRRAHSGSRIDRLPSPESDPEIEIPDVTMPHTKSKVEEPPTDPTVALDLIEQKPGKDETRTKDTSIAARHRARSAALFVTAGLALVIGVIGFIATTAPPTQQPAQNPSPPPALAVEPAPIELARKDAPTATNDTSIASAETQMNGAVKLHVESTPPAAKLEADGDIRCTTPCDLKIPRGQAAITIRISREGYLPYNDTVRPDVDRRLLVQLSPLLKNSTSDANAARTKRRPPSPASSSPVNNDKPIFERFE